MAVSRWNPFQELFALQDEMNRLFEDTLRGPSRRPSPNAWLPPVDIFETADNFEIKVELPGVKKEEVTLEVRENTLTLRGERRQEKDTKEQGVHRIERVYGPFLRSFTLPSNIDTNNVKAVFQDGVLTIVLPKAEEAKPKQIRIAA
jgi:HSP20 family protein